MKNFITSIGHYLTGLAGIGAISALVVEHDVTGSAGLPVIVAIVAALVGGGLAAPLTSNSSSSTTNSTTN
jgi:hypothetical protein